MTSKILSSLLVTCVLVTTAFAQNLPSYYTEDGFQRTGRIDAVRLEERVVIINDIEFTLSESIVVHSLSNEKDSIGRLTSGKIVGYRLGSNAEIAEIWLLPSYYDRSRRGR